jgi:hypothetical protein
MVARGGPAPPTPVGGVNSALRVAAGVIYRGSVEIAESM